MTQRFFGWVATLAMMATSPAAFAWDPNQSDAGATMPRYVVQPRYYAQPYGAPVAPTSNYAAPIVTATPAPSPYAAPSPYPAPPPPVAADVPYAPPIATAPEADAYPTSARSTEATTGLVRNQYALGIEAMYDNYEEPDVFPDLHTDSYYGGITGSMTHYFTPQMFGMLDGHWSYGQADYYSDQGHSGGIPQWEFEARAMGGFDMAISDHSHLKPYTGFGARYFYQNGKDTYTQTSIGYDRRIWQYYIPVGATYEYKTASGLTISPNFEVDPMVFGQVKSRVGETGLTNGENFKNDQHDGIGYRAQIMVSQKDEHGRGVEFGPFFRYWDVKDSSADDGAIEPHNNRFQLGADLKYLF